SCDPFKIIQGWTSGNNNIDDCIREFQLKSSSYESVIEWIPFDKLSNIQKIEELKFYAQWLDGIRRIKNNVQSRTASYTVTLMKFNFSQVDALEFIKNDEKHILYGITQDTITGQYMIVFDDFYYKRDIKYGKCTQCERYNTTKAWCQSCDPFKTTQGWTSGNKDIDDCIREFQLKSTSYEGVIEWIPYNRLSNLHKIGSNFQALWLDEIRKVENNTRSHTTSHPVEIKKFNNSQIDTLEFIKEFKNYVQLKNYGRKIFGITQDTTTNQYMIVFDDYYYNRSYIYGKCTQCERNNTSEAWCQSCDPFKTTQGWTSGNNDIDDCVKEFQLKCTRHEDVIEWIPFNRLSDLQKIGLNFKALWLDGIRVVKNNIKSRLLVHAVELRNLNDSQITTLEFIHKFKNYMQLIDIKLKFYGITKNTTDQYMVVYNELYYERHITYGKCEHCNRYNTSNAWCLSCDPFKTTQGWTSGNKDIDNCIKEFQLESTRYQSVIEWIPYNRLSDLHKIGLNFQALWLDGMRIVHDNRQLRTLSYPVIVKKFNNSQIGTLEFIKEFKNYAQLDSYGCKIFGITQDTTTDQYMIVFSDYSYERSHIYGKCTRCERYNTSEAWCQSCDPFETAQGWTSGNIAIDNCIRNFQLESERYENVIEWIPFNRLSNLQKVGLNFQGLWVDGIRFVKKNIQSRTLSYPVEIKKFDNSQIDTLELDNLQIETFDFIMLKDYINSIDSEQKLFGITQDTTTSEYLFVFDYFHCKRDIKYGICTQCDGYNTLQAWCQFCDPFKTTQGWTSGNKDIDDYIKEFQLKSASYENVVEWIPFNRLSDLHKIGLNFQALWLDGIRIVKNNTQSRILPYPVEIKKFDNSQIDTLEIIKEFKNYMQLRDKERKIFGITQDTTTSEYLIVCDNFYYKRDIKYGRCKHCNRYNTSKSWCLSCDPFKTTQKWTSEDDNIDYFIKELQLKSTIYEGVIEWIPFNKLSNLQKMESNFQALWLDGIRFVKNDIQSRTLSYAVELAKISNSQINTLKFIKEFKNHAQLRDNERKIFVLTWDEKTNQCMIVFDEFYYRRDIVYGICTQCKRYNTSKAWCQSCDPFKTTQGWTSGNNDIDVFIKEAQLKSTEYENVIEWIPFNRLSNLRRTGVKFQALWLDGIRKIENNTQSRTLSYSVEIQKLNNLQIDTSNFIKEDNECKLYGITQDTKTDQYMIVFDDFYYLRGIAVGKCNQCERNNTSEAWCLSCDPIKTTRGWASGNRDIDNCIKDFQLKSTRYEDVIEWIPFNKLFNLQKIGESKFLALLIDGIRQVKNNSQSRTLSCFKKYIQLRNNESKLYGITRDTTTGHYIIAFDDFYHKRDIIYGKCIRCERYNTSEAWCQSCDLFKTIQGWTSGNSDIDECIKEFQLKATKYEDVIEWIPFYKLLNLQNIREYEFRAQWLDGIRKVESRKLSYSQVNTLEFVQSRTLSHSVELKKFDDSQIDALEFIKKFKNYMQLKDSKLRLYGITQDASTDQYMIVFDGFYYGRDITYGKCAHCNRYNTSDAWCQSCDPFKVIQGWTSGSKDIDDCIKGFQLKSTRYEDVIEWIPFNRLSNLHKIDESKFYALWLDGIRKVKKKAQLRTLPCLVELQKFDGCQTDALEFIKKFKSFVQFENNGHKIFGITQNASSKQYMIVIDYCISRRDEKYGVCRWDGHYNTSRGWCQSCDPFEMNQVWTSESIDVNNCIKELQFMATEYDKVIEWIPFNRLNNIQQIGKGGFGDVFSANWIDGKRKVLNDGKGFIQSRIQSHLVALKTLTSSSNSMDFLREFKNHMRCRLMGSSLEVYGLTKNTITNQYMIVLQYANNGNLRHYLETNFKELTWKDKLSRLMDISKDLSLIHEAKYIHCDLHSGNIVLHKEGSWLERSKTYIIDLGLSRKNEDTGALRICNGLRPKFALETPDFYVEFSELCMNFAPQKRPTAEEIFHKLEEWYHLINEFDETKDYDDTQELDSFEFDEIDEIDESKVEMFNKFLESDEIVKKLPMSMQIHQDSEYTSKFVNTDVVSERYWE
ncbi:9817_t:CDS:10, partial [Acaulospora morrowiae]